MCDWSYGKLYALHLTPEGSAYKGEVEEFVSGTPLAADRRGHQPEGRGDVLHHRRPQDAVGPLPRHLRRQRIDRAGEGAPRGPKPTTAPAPASWRRFTDRRTRRRSRRPGRTWAIADRYIRFAARVAIEHQDPKTWQERALNEKDRPAAINALLALVRATGQDPLHHPKPGDRCRTRNLHGPILDALDRIDLDKLTTASSAGPDPRLSQSCSTASASRSDAERKQRHRQPRPAFPGKARELNADAVPAAGLPGGAGRRREGDEADPAAAPTQEEQMEYAKSLRVLKTGWTPDLRKEYFTWFLKGGTSRAAPASNGFINKRMKADAVATLTAKTRRRS